MGALDTAFGQLVPALLGAFSDTPAVFTRTESSYDAANDTHATSTLTASVLTSPPEGYALQLINNTTIQAGDRKVTTTATYGALGSPRIGDSISRGELIGTVVSVSPINSGDAVAAYDLQIRTH